MCGNETDKNYYRGSMRCLGCAVKKTHEIHTEENKYEWIECRICGYRAKEISAHVKTVHGIEPKDYGITKSQAKRDAMSGDKNPAAGHGGRLSPWSKKFKHGYDESRHENFKKKHSEKMKNNPNNTFVREFYATDEDYSNAQRRDLKWFVSKYGEEEGKIRHASKIEKWMKNFKRQNFSKISQELFSAIDEIYDGDVYYATKDRPEMFDHANKEYKIKEIRVSLDFVDLNTKKVIEFDGDYWHGKKGNIEREKIRDQKIIDLGYTILHVKESDFKADRQGTIKRCLEFLTQ